MKARELFFSLGGRCRHRCLFCPSPGGTAEVPSSRLYQAIAAAPRYGVERLTFVGGEPTMRRDLPQLMAETVRLGLSIGLVTDGQAFADEATLEAYRNCGLEAVTVLLHGPDAASHEQLAGALSFEKTLEGLERLSRLPGLELTIRTALARSNAGRLPGLMAWLARQRREAHLGVSLFYPAPAQGGGRMKALTLTPEEAARQIDQALKAASQSGLKVFWEGLPPCLLPLRREAHLPGGHRIYARYTIPPLCQPDRGRLRHLRPARCSACRDTRCQGPDAALFNHYGDSAVRPADGRRSCSYNYLRGSAIEGFEARRENCPAPALALEGPAPRHLIVEQAGACHLYSTDTEDFTDEEIRRVKELNQLYLDICQKPAPDDFPVDLRRLTPLKVCRGCSRQEGCPRVYHVDENPPFLQESAWLDQQIGKLRGRVLDVGSGDGRYHRERLKALIAGGAISYQALDPDGEALARLRDNGIEAKTLHAMQFESFEAEPGSFDAILCLRSVNHFHDLRATTARLCELLSPGGTLLLADGIPLALLRTPGQIARAHAEAPGIFEHFSNLSSQEVLEIMAPLPLEVAAHHPVGPDRANLWLLMLRKPG